MSLFSEQYLKCISKHIKPYYEEPEFLMHFTKSKHTESIKKYGLDPQKSVYDSDMKVEQYTNYKAVFFLANNYQWLIDFNIQSLIDAGINTMCIVPFSCFDKEKLYVRNIQEVAYKYAFYFGDPGKININETAKKYNTFFEEYGNSKSFLFYIPEFLYTGIIRPEKITVKSLLNEKVNE